MNSREKVLATCVGALAIAWGGYSLAPQLAAPLTQRAKDTAKLRTELSKRRELVQQQENAVKELKEWEASSLPGDTSRVALEYKDWIYNLARELGFKDVIVTPNPKPAIANASVPGRKPVEVYRELTWTVSAQTDLAALTRFLHAFHKRDFLHRITSLQLERKANGKQLGLTATLSALIVPSAEAAAELSSREAHRVALADLAQYESLIVGRNPFGGKNTPPAFADTNAKEAVAGKSASFTLTANDSDGDKVSYELVQGIDGASFDNNSAQLTFTPTEGQVGQELKLKVAAIDDAVPAHRQEQEFIIRVKSGETVPTGPGFENTKYTFITGFVERNDKPQVMVHEKPTNQVFHLFEGDKFQIGEFQGTIKQIRKLEVDIESGGKSYTWPWVISLHEALSKPAGKSDQVAQNSG